MARKPITESTQTRILLKSRRRCCLCFWLKGEDEVKKGQLAHLDGDHENSEEANLAFMCLEHHDEYDSSTSQSKGLREPEVKKWRDELYREMQYRFRSMKRKECTLAVEGFVWKGPDDEISVKLATKNTGEIELKHVTVAIGLIDGIDGDIPPPENIIETPYGALNTVMPEIDFPWTPHQAREDFFEKNGRVCIKEMHPLYSVLMPGYSDRFEALLIHLKVVKPGQSVDLDYRIDADEMPAMQGKLALTMPSDPSELGCDEGE